uniref:Cystatin n=1 Tax=Calliophis bivirgatus TaxID=8633 RepID=A0A898IL60_CALBG|nr:cystatin [Calliophis bivirgatus]
MGRSLLGLLGAVLMLPPVLLTETDEHLYQAPINHPYVQKALAFAVEKYNLDREDSSNYFNVMRVLKAQWKVSFRVEYHLKVELVKTTCEKVGEIKKYNKIKKCNVLQGNHKRPICYFRVVPDCVSFEMNVEIAVCV